MRALDRAGGRSAVVDDFRELRLFGGGKRVSERARLSQDKGHRAEWEVLRRVLTQGAPADRDGVVGGGDGG